MIHYTSRDPPNASLAARLRLACGQMELIEIRDSGMSEYETIVTALASGGNSGSPSTAGDRNWRRLVCPCIRRGQGPNLCWRRMKVPLRKARVRQVREFHKYVSRQRLQPRRRRDVAPFFERGASAAVGLDLRHTFAPLGLSCAADRCVEKIVITP